jgi:hypothetical protein
MMQLKYTTLMGISTAEGERNFYTQLMRMKNLDGTPLFRVVDTGLVCDACLASGKASECTHLLHKVSQWKSTKRMAIFKQVMKGDPEKYAREVLGAGVTTERGTFDTDVVDACFAKDAMLLHGPLPTICVAIDPSGGGSGSDYAIVSFTMMDDKCVVPTHTPPLTHHITHHSPTLPVSYPMQWYRVGYNSTYPFVESTTQIVECPEPGPTVSGTPHPDCHAHKHRGALVAKIEKPASA